MILFVLVDGHDEMVMMCRARRSTLESAYKLEEGTLKFVLLDTFTGAYD